VAKPIIHTACRMCDSSYICGIGWVLRLSQVNPDSSPSNPPHGAIQSRRRDNACKYLAYIQERPRSKRRLGGGQHFDCLQRLEPNLPYYYFSLGNSLSSRLLALSQREAVHHRTRVSFCALIPIPGLRSIKRVPEPMTPRTWLVVQFMFMSCSV
jgi:hypothetical protein